MVVLELSDAVDAAGRLYPKGADDFTRSFSDKRSCTV